MLLCTPSAYGQGAQIDVDTIYIDSRAVDLGLTVYWSNINVGQNSNSIGDFFRGVTYVSLTKWWSIENWSDSQSWQNWRIPSRIEALSLSYKFSSYTNNMCVFSGNNNSITIPTTKYKMGGVLGENSISEGYMFWTSDGTGSVFNHYEYYYVLRYTNNSVATDLLDYVNALLIRPVIDKVTLTYKISESKNNTTSEKYSDSVTVPKGTKVKLTPIYDDCHTFLYWKKNDQRFSGDDSESITVTVDANDTYKAIFKEKDPVKVTVYTADSDKGTVSIAISN